MGYRESWQALLEMLDPQRFARGVEPDRAVVAEVMVRRLKDDLTRPDGSPRFPGRTTRAIEVTYTDAERQAHELLAAYVIARRRAAATGSTRPNDLVAAARQRLAGGQRELKLGLDAVAVAAAGSGPLKIASSQMSQLWQALCTAYDALGFDGAVGGDEVFQQLVLARIIEPTSKQDSLRVLAEVGVEAASYPTLNRHLPGYASDKWRQKLAAACAAHASLGPTSLVMFDVSTLYFETDTGDGFREPGFSKERRLAADHDRAAHRRIWVPADGGGVRGQPCRDHHQCIQAHLNIVFAALAVSRLLEECTGWSIKRFVRTTRRYRTVHIRAGAQMLTAEDPIPEDLRDTLAKINRLGDAH